MAHPFPLPPFVELDAVSINIVPMPDQLELSRRGATRRALTAFPSGLSIAWVARAKRADEVEVGQVALPYCLVHEQLPLASYSRQVETITSSVGYVLSDADTGPDGVVSAASDLLKQVMLAAVNSPSTSQQQRTTVCAAIASFVRWASEAGLIEQ